MSDQTIFRVSGPNRSYTKISNVLLEDPSISFACKGFLVSILRLPSNWSFNVKWLCNTYGVTKGAAYKLVDEAIERGYCARRRLRAPDGTLSGGTEYVFSDAPEELTAASSGVPNRNPENPDNGGTVITVVPKNGITGRIQRTDSNYKEKGEGEGAAFDGQKIELGGRLREFWLAKFDGDAERLELALIAAVPYVQPNSRQPIEAQVSAQLARSAADKRDRDKRATARASSGPPPNARAEAKATAHKQIDEWMKSQGYRT
jgi:hypothetical protein